MNDIREKMDKRDESLKIMFLLGIKAVRNIIVVGVNLDIDTIDNLDSTSIRIDYYCIQHNYEGWILNNSINKIYLI